MHLAAYVARRIFLDGSKLLIPFINPIVPIDIKSSCSTFAVEYFLLTCATSLKFLSINMLRASSSPFFNLSKNILSSSELKGSGKRLEL